MESSPPTLSAADRVVTENGNMRPDGTPPKDRNDSAADRGNVFGDNRMENAQKVPNGRTLNVNSPNVISTYYPPNWNASGSTFQCGFNPPIMRPPVFIPTNRVLYQQSPQIYGQRLVPMNLTPNIPNMVNGYAPVHGQSSSVLVHRNAPMSMQPITVPVPVQAAPSQYAITVGDMVYVVRFWFYSAGSMLYGRSTSDGIEHINRCRNRRLRPKPTEPAIYGLAHHILNIQYSLTKQSTASKIRKPVTIPVDQSLTVTLGVDWLVHFAICLLFENAIFRWLRFAFLITACCALSIGPAGRLRPINASMTLAVSQFALIQCVYITYIFMTSFSFWSSWNMIPFFRVPCPPML